MTRAVLPERCRVEQFFGEWESGIEHLACASDVDGLTMHQLLELADPETEALWRDLDLGYTDTVGHPLLREAIVGQYASVSIDEVTVCGGGAAEALFLLAHALLGPGDHCVVVWPAFESLHRIAPTLGATVTPVALDPQDGWRLDLEAVRRALRPTTRALFVNFPHNPTGALPDRGDFERLLALAREAGVTVVSDEVYRGLEYDPATMLPAACDVDDRAVSIGVMSKAYGLAGLRVGWLATGNGAVTEATRVLKDYTTVCASAPAEILSIIAMRAHARIVERSRSIVLANLAVAESFFDRHREVFDWASPRAGPMAFPRLRLPVDVDTFVADLAREQSVLFLPGTVFGMTDNRLRVGLGRGSLPAALARVDDYLATRT
ncbi:MAG: aminotransferase class I/II-fold pyridoxal phosphate-dependent enzyme [Nocardioides sp.]|uniref:aminotransferase class I/II-fold pyridoxal phosphate-dependent enzyme n=1 Tax=Nocardioides sp. TaxID=35761 RepID=UPI00239DB72C|nr:aminotransferase class I/II-fold pyridoxal phosphate-dependent enzyme [Nocardioides sp.]MDE0777045.1 aminotransferase class I/II-fold pyridoxal phosphate-dependent enzyme [Nocardioides sp.]